MKSAKKLNRLTYNPLTLLFGVNHAYLGRVTTFTFRLFTTIIVLIFTAIVLSSERPNKAFIFLIIIYISYLIIDKIRIKKHLDKYNTKFQEGLDLLRDKEFFSAFKKFLKLGGLKEPIFYIIENEPSLLTDTMAGNLKKEDFQKLCNIVENRDVESIISFVKSTILKNKLLNK